MRKILFMVCLALLVYLPAQAKPVAIDGIGEVDIPENVLVLQYRIGDGELNYCFRVKEGEIFRGAVLFLPKFFSFDEETSNIERLLDQIPKHLMQKYKSYVLEIQKPKIIILKGKECYMVTMKRQMPPIIERTDFLVIPEFQGIKLTSFSYSDSDAQYWRSIMLKIASMIP